MTRDNARCDSVVLVFSKAPVAGEVKTRLIPALGEEGARQLHQQLLTHTLKTVVDLDDCGVELWWSGELAHPFLKNISNKLTVHQQPTGDLGAKMHCACKHALQRYKNVIVIGTDCPVIDLPHLVAVRNALRNGNEVVITPAEDGGYVLIAMRRCYPEIFQGIDWSTDRVFSQTQAALTLLDIKWQAMPSLWDVDRKEDLVRWQEVQHKYT